MSADKDPAPLLPPTQTHVPDRDEVSTVGEAGHESRKDSAPLPAEVEASLPQIPGYEVLGYVARGGMGVVVKARQCVLDRVVAVKVPLAHQLASPADRERFLREARSAARLRHPHICPIYEVGQQADRPYIVMGFIHGETLAAWARQRKATARQAAELVAKLARAVGYAHAHGVIHRDIKPANVMVDDETGQPVLMDFGLAKELTDQSSQLSHSGRIMGTPAYMAPEQAAGNLRQVGPLADVYALGAVLYELLCGRPPYHGALWEVLRKVQTEEAVAPRRLVPQLHRDLETICLKALAREPQARYGSAVALAEDLERFCAGEAVQARREGLGRKLWRKVRRNPLTVGAAVALVVAAAVLGIVTPPVYRPHRVTTLTRDVQAAIESPDWSAEQLGHVDALLKDLDPLDPAGAEAGREAVRQRFGLFIAEQIKKQRLDPDDERRIGEWLDLLAGRDEPAAARLREEFERRRSGWVPVFALPPLDQADALFAREPLRREGDVLVRGTTEPAESAARFLPRTGSSGPVQLAAVFDASWQKATQLGLVLNGSEGKGYSFLLEAPARRTAADREDPPRKAGSFREARTDQNLVQLRLLRDGVLLRQQQVKSTDLFAVCPADGSLYLEAQRAGDRLTFQVNRLPPLEFRDPFPLSTSRPGTFGLHWPAGVGLRDVHAARLATPPAPSALERADDLYNQGDYESAGSLYQELLPGLPDAALRQEALCKQGLCLAARNRLDDAVSLFQQVAAESGDHWPLLADCQLWLAALRRDRPADADALLDRIFARYGFSFEGLALLVPDDVRMGILTKYGFAKANYVLRKPEDLLRDAKRASRVAELLEPVPHQRYQTQWHFWTGVALLKAYFVAGQLDEATKPGDALIAEYGDDPSILDYYCWALRARGDYDRDLAVANRVLAPPGPSPAGSAAARFLPLLERARIHVARQEWDPAESDLNEFFRLQQQTQQAGYQSFSAACLVQGELRQRRGDAAGALESWRRGLLKNYAPPSADGPPAFELTPSGALHNQVLASLTQDVTDADADKALEWMVSFAGQKSTAARTVWSMALSTGTMRDVLRETYRTPRGKEWAERIAYRTCSFADYSRMPSLLLIAEITHQTCLPPGALSKEQDELVWQMVQDCYVAYLDQRLTEANLLALAFLLKGNSVFGPSWEDVANALPPSLPGPLAYVFGERRLRQQRPEEAAKFFKDARDRAPADAPLRHLAQSELDRLNAR
jgi:tetratricopeptide (TPR) repeat protein